jgi:hypothetical protein
LKEEVRAAIDCDPETWAIMAINPMDGGFEEYWRAAETGSAGEQPDPRNTRPEPIADDDRERA